MIKITIEVCPPLLTGRPRKTIAKAIIINDGSGTKERGNYEAKLWLKRKNVWEKVEVKNFPRKSYNIWELLKRILNAV